MGHWGRSLGHWGRSFFVPLDDLSLIHISPIGKVKVSKSQINGYSSSFFFFPPIRFSSRQGFYQGCLAVVYMSCRSDNNISHKSSMHYLNILLIPSYIIWSSPSKTVLKSMRKVSFTTLPIMGTSKCLNCLSTVSYTHLDVYKRQG